ncbi:hypothetical protein, partial [Vibrio mediterranei]|uniref:hypothetical protein n=1 Tax=Vibrio mediterranei TaxID=689 RepID=UPI001EFE7517
MIDEFLDLANEIGLKNEKKLRKKFKGYDVSESNLIKQLEEELSNNLFTYEFFSGILEKDSKLGSSFVIHSADGYEYIKYSSGVYYSKSSNIDISEYVGFRFFVLKEVVNVVPVDDMIREIVDLTPLWSALLLVLTPFVLLTPLYVNIFNTRLVYSNSAVTLLFVSIFFAMTLMLEFTVKKYIKDKSLKSNAKSAVKLERYFLKFIPYYSGISAVHS